MPPLHVRDRPRLIAFGNQGGHGTLAYESGTFSLIRKPASGPETRDRGKYMFIWRFYPAQKAWLIDYTIWSSDLPQRVTVPSAD